MASTKKKRRPGRLTVPGSFAETVPELLDRYTPPQWARAQQLLDVIRRHMPAGLVESTRGNMIRWTVPIALCPGRRNGLDLPLAALVGRDDYDSLYLCGGATPYAAFDDEHQDAYRLTRHCVRVFSTTPSVEDAIKASISGWTAERMVASAKELGRY
ncbi:MAG TPA: hypothetical protein ENK18_09150 [Deltaproteobacteria bacterium]|nr:hypothetical protein [Deltaproteobacteria bacterium]